MPRKSEAALNMGRLNLQDNPGAIETPPDLPASIKHIVADLIASQVPEHFRDGDGYLLEQYAQSIVAARKAFAKLEKDGYTVNGKTNPWLIVLEKAHRSSVALAGRLRLAPQQRMDQEKAGRERHNSHRGGLGVTWRQLQDNRHEDD